MCRHIPARTRLVALFNTFWLKLPTGSLTLAHGNTVLTAYATEREHCGLLHSVIENIILTVVKAAASIADLVGSASGLPTIAGWWRLGNLGTWA